MERSASMKRIVNALGELSSGKRAYAVFVLCATTAIALPAQTFTTLFSFDSRTGKDPYAGLVQATDGDFYGTTVYGGTNGAGTVFKITPSGTLTTLYSFCSQGVPPDCTDGANPYAGLIQATDGDFYGTTNAGGNNSEACSNDVLPAGCGTVFKITPSGTLTTLYSFCAQLGCPDGLQPYAGLVLAGDGDFYGTTRFGGANCSRPCGGTVFKITPSGTLTTLYSFCSQSGCADGSRPEAGLVQATNGDFYGTTYEGGVTAETARLGGGTIFEITPSGTLTTLYSFCSQIGCTDGAQPGYGLVQATNGDFYGTTANGGANSPNGTVFKITPSGTLTTLYNFCGCTDGEYPRALIQATNGDFYGTTSLGGGADGGGTVFKMTPSGMLTTLYSFCSQGGFACTDGDEPDGGLVQATDGDFYGTTWTGGANGDGVVFSLSVGLGPFVETRPTAGKAGEVVEILGTDLTGATSVSFNGTAAVFKVVSSSEIATVVPAGASSGKVQVVTPNGTLSSNVPFRVLP
jgi:uncharacterized repeat protein (TIGR03803 family)